MPFATKIIRAAGAEPGSSYGRQGKARLLQRAKSRAAAARSQPWLVLVDQDGEHGCTPAAARAWCPDELNELTFRVVPHAIEAWAPG